MQEIGIRSQAAYIPMLRLSLGAISGGRKASGGGGEKAVAYFDEDAVTMAVAAGSNCLEGLDRSGVDALYFASTSYPYREKQGAALIAKALDLRREVLTADVTDSTRAATVALRAALDAVRAGTARNALVIAADARPAPPRTPMERNFGDAAVAFLIGSEDVAAIFEEQVFLAEEIIDVWRTEWDRFVRSWEERFVVERGYTENTVAAIRALLEKAGAKPGDFRRLVAYTPDARSLQGVARATGFDPKTQLQDPLFGRVGNCGAAFAPLLLAAALEEAQEGQRFLWANYGDGADAMVVRTTAAVARLARRRGVQWHLARRRELTDYDRYLNYRNLYPTESDRRAGQGVSATVHYRDRNEDIAFHGQRCRRCGTEQFPFQRVCFQCFARDDFDEIRLAERQGKVMSFTFDYFAGSPDPPLIVTTIEVEGGARVYLQMTDASPSEVKLDMPVEFTFRKIHEYGGTPNYFWKCTPVRSISW
ncbi:MAG: ACP synthase [Candidatus Binatia bacterium]|nr:MAG: ACP synthase [Candidatus Binatia bacterium]